MFGRSAAMVVAAVIGVGPAGAQPADPAAAFKARLISALASGNPRQIAALVKYPIRVTTVLPHPIPVNTAAEMVTMQHLFFTPEMRCAIEESRVARPGQAAPRFAMLVAEGVVSLASGRVIAERTPQGYRITRLTVLGQAAGPANARPKPVIFRWGEGERWFSGRLGGDGVDGYLITARAGDLLQAKIERFPGRSLQLRVTEVGTGRVIQGAQTEYSRLWAARVPAAGDYRLDVVRRAAYCDPSVTYLLTLGLRR